MESTTLNQLIEAFQVSGHWKGLAPKSQQAYSRYLRKFSEKDGKLLLPSSGFFENVSPKNVAQGPFLRSQAPNPRSLSDCRARLGGLLEVVNGTQDKRMARRVLTVLLGWGETNGFFSLGRQYELPLPRLNEKDRLPFTVEEIEKLQGLGTPDLEARLLPYVKAAVFSFHTGMRPNEVTNLKWEDIRDDFVYVKSAKAREQGTVARICKLTEGARAALPERRSEYVFESVTGKTLNKDTRSEAIQEACRAVGIRPRDFYSTRRGTATEMFRRGYDIAHIKSQLGHRDIATTLLYIKPSMLEAAQQFKGF